jgi:DNA-directed RNA polymerase subunit H (RpoH/RPB5)
MHWQNLARMRRTEAQMMRDRGFELDEEDLELISLPAEISHEFELEYLKKLTNAYAKVRREVNRTFSSMVDKVYRRNEKNWIIIHVFSEKKVSVADVRYFFETIEHNLPHHLISGMGPGGSDLRIDGAILVTVSSMASQALAHYNTWHEKFPVQHFMLSQLLYNPLHHYLTPHYTHITKRDQIRKMLSVRNLNQADVPHILKTDVIAMYFGAQRGDILVERSDASDLNTIVKTHTLWRLVR